MEILVVEDNAVTARDLQENMNGWDHRVEISKSGKEAIEKASRRAYDLVLLDIFLPDCRGYELIPQLKAFKHDIPIVTMTGHNTRELELKVRQQGISYYLIKPFSMKDLRSIVEHVSSRINAKEV